MFRILSFILVAFFCNVNLLDAKTESATAPSYPQGKYFVENKGQVSDQEKRAAGSVLYTIEQPGLVIYLTNSGLTYLFIKPEKEEEEEENEESFEYRYERFDLDLSGATIRKDQITADKPGPHTLNFYYGKPKCIIENLRGYEHLLIRNVYPGIDWSLHVSGDGGGLKYDFIVHPGADPSLIKLLYRGKSPLTFPDKKTIRISTKLGNLEDSAPLAYYGDQKENVSVQYAVFSEEKKRSGLNHWNETAIGFSLGKYDPNSTLVIDPAQLWWGTYFNGSSQKTLGHGIVTDYNGNLDLGGVTTSASFPAYNPGNNAYFQGTIIGSQNVFLSQFNAAGTLVWSTYFGGSLNNELTDIIVTASNDMIVTGYTSSADLVTLNPGNGAYFQSALGGQYDGFILKFSPTGVLNWSTYFGDDGIEKIISVAVDQQGSVFMTGNIDNVLNNMTTLPLVNPGGAYQQNMNPGGFSDVFILRLSPAGNLNWFTYFGGSADDGIAQLATSLSGEIAMVGGTYSTDLPVLSSPQTNDYYQPVYGGAYDGFIIKFSPACALYWCTYIGGNNLDHAGNIAFDHHSELLIAGGTQSSNFPVYNPGNGAYFSNTGYTFIARLNDSLELNWCTRAQLGSNQMIMDHRAFKIGPCNEVYVGATAATSNPGVLMNPGNGAYYLGTAPGMIDLVLVEFNSSNQLQWGSFIGGAGTDDGILMTVDQAGAIYLTGDAGAFMYTSSTVGTFQNNCLMNPGGGAYYQHTPGSYTDNAYIMKLNPVFPSVSASSVSSAPTCPAYNDGTITLNLQGGNPGYTTVWQPGNMTGNTLSNLGPGTYFYTVQDTQGCQVQGSVQLIQQQAFNIDILASPVIICSGDSAILTALGAPSVNWQPGGNGNPITVAPAVTTTYIASYADTSGCISSDSVTVGVIPRPSISMYGDSTVCQGDYVQVGMTGANQIVWLNVNSVGNPANFLFPSDTTVYAMGTNGNGCNDTASFHVDVQPVPYVFAFAPNDTLCSGEIVIAFGSAPSDSILWSNGSTNDTIVVTQSGLYTVTVTNQYGCTATDYVSVVVSICDGIEEYSLADFSAWPNPASGDVQLNLPAGKNWQMDVMDARGRLVMTANVRGPQTTISTAGWAEGLYIIRLGAENKTYELKLVKTAGD